jgi:hypothetical protein
MNIPDNEARAIGHDYQASAILQDADLCPFFSEEGRKDVAYALKLLAIMERAKPGTSPWDAVLARVVELELALRMEKDNLAMARGWNPAECSRKFFDGASRA